jgi:NADPH:quinone reductase
MVGTPRQVIGQTLAELAGLVLDGRLKPQVGGVYALKDASQGHGALESRGSTGKLVLVP